MCTCSNFQMGLGEVIVLNSRLSISVPLMNASEVGVTEILMIMGQIFTEPSKRIFDCNLGAVPDA